MLVLPQAFGTVFLGETFSSFVNVFNSGREQVREVALRAELQPGSAQPSATAAFVPHSTAVREPPGAGPAFPHSARHCRASWNRPRPSVTW